MANGDDRNFWEEIKRIRRHKTGGPVAVDGLTDIKEIAQLFATKYRELYTSVPYDSVELNHMLNSVNETIGTATPEITDCRIDLVDVHTAVCKLKAHKKDGCGELTSDHLISAGLDCMEYVANLFTSIIVHGSFADNFLYSTIPKGRNANVSNSANYRGIALSSIFGKNFDNIILERYQTKLLTGDLQFGFKAKCSRYSCT